MNLQIKQLIDTVGTDVSGKWMAVDKVELIAELIVQECVGVLNRRFMGDLNREDMEVRCCINDVKEHFGVEEPKGWICPKCSADRTKIACPLGFGATVDGRCPMTVEAQ